MSSSNVTVSILTMLAFVSCSGATPTSPTSMPALPANRAPTGPSNPPSPIPGSVTLSGLTPSSGATLTLRDCSNGGWESICTEDFQLAMEVVLQRNVPDARVRIAFYDGALPCVETTIWDLSFEAGVAQTLSSRTNAPRMFARYQVSEGDGPRETIQRCDLPATTNKLAVEVFNARDVRAPIIVTEFDSTYTFSAPRATRP